MHQTTLSSAARDDLSHARQAYFVPLDVIAFLVAALMILGPLAAGTLR
jgi:hypothetical protein